MLVKQLTYTQKGKDTKKKKKKLSKMDTLPTERKNKKEMEFEIKLAKEKEEILEREKQMKINRLLQEVQYLAMFCCLCSSVLFNNNVDVS